MGKNRRTMSVKMRTLRATMRRLGCVKDRQRGTHETWRTPGGSCITMVLDRAGRNVLLNEWHEIKRILAREGIDLKEAIES